MRFHAGKYLVIGDTHFDNWYPGYLQTQIDVLEELIKEHSPYGIIFLGDIFHHRKPDPTTIVEVYYFFKWVERSGIRTVILKGNHDSASKSDNDDTILHLFDDFKDFDIFDHIVYDKQLNLIAIPHFENENIVKHFLSHPETFYSSCPQNAVIIGHVGYKGCMNVQNDYTFTIEPNLFKHRTILGHIHRWSEKDNITILGTPWSTNFGETDYTHYVGVMELNESGRWSELRPVKMGESPRFLVYPYESLEAMKEEIYQPEKFTALRVVINKFEDDSTSDLKAKILKDYMVDYVDIKFQPIYDKKLNNRLSDYDPQSAISKISDNIVEKYLDEQKSTIPTEDLRKGLDKINNHADQED